MAERYRGAGGRFTTSAAAYFREIFDIGTRRTIERERIEREPETLPPPPPPVSNWEEKDYEGGGVVRYSTDGQPLSDDAYDDVPYGAESFQVRFIVPSHPNYPRGWASYSNLDMSEWDDIDGIIEEGDRPGFAGVGAIIFRYGNS